VNDVVVPYLKGMNSTIVRKASSLQRTFGGREKALGNLVLSILRDRIADTFASDRAKYFRRTINMEWAN